MYIFDENHGGALSAYRAEIVPVDRMRKSELDDDEPNSGTNRAFELSVLGWVAYGSFLLGGRWSGR